MVVLREKSYILAEMNRGNVLQSSPVQQMSMAAGGPNWWSINGGSRRPPLPTVVPAVVPPQQANFMAPPPPSFFPHHQYFPPPAAPPNNSWLDLVTTHEFLPDSLSQLLMNGILVGDEEEKSALSHMQAAAAKKLENWEQQLLQNHRQIDDDGGSVAADHRYVKQENPASANNYGYAGHDHQFQQGLITQVDANCWSTSVPTPPMIPVSSPSSCVSSLSSTNMLDFSTTKAADVRHPPPPPDRSSECNSTATGGAAKKAKIQHSSTQSPFKVRKEKLGDRITALHQLVSPFGKTDTASVLLEAIGYIRFLQSQIEALSLPYLGNGSGNMRHQHSVQGGEMNCLFPEDPGQLLNDNCMKRKGAPDVQDAREESKKDLRSRGLCLVPVSCTMQVGSDNGADYWAPALNGSFR